MPRSNEDYIRKAVELADGWSFTGKSVVNPPTQHLAMSIHNLSTWFLDALAAQLIRQVDALDGKYFFSNGVATAAIHSNSFDLPDGDFADASEITVEGPDRTMNTIKAIVDSGVLT